MTRAAPVGNSARWKNMGTDVGRVFLVALLAGSDFIDGVIEVERNRAVVPGASRLMRLFTRGVIGLCGRVSANFQQAECACLRPENG